jgi:hypothetical protein
MIRYLLILALVALVARALWRILDGVIEGLRGAPRTSTPPLIGHMERDPVCGTYVVRGRAVTLADGRRQLYFCSTGCRDEFRARGSSPAGGSGPKAVEGRAG